MDSQADALAAAIGGRVKVGRQSRRWTLEKMADRAGVSRRALINVEQGAANPSVGTLLRISDALGIGLPALVESPEPRGLKVTRRGQGASLWSGEFGGRGVLVAGTEPPDVVELWEWTLGPDDRHVSEAHATGTRELMHVLEGTVVVKVAEQSITLKVGDAAAFPGDMEHSYLNPGKKSARFSLCVVEPGVGSGFRPEAATSKGVR